MGIIIILILPIVLTIISYKFSQKLLPIVPILEFGAVTLFNKFIYTARGAGFDQLWLIIGPMIAIIVAILLLINKKQHVLKITAIVIVILLIFVLLDYSLEIFHKGILIWILPF